MRPPATTLGESDMLYVALAGLASGAFSEAPPKPDLARIYQLASDQYADDNERSSTCRDAILAGLAAVEAVRVNPDA